MQLAAASSSLPETRTACKTDEVQVTEAQTGDRIPGVALVFFNGSFMRGTNGSHTRAAESLAYLVRTFERVVFYSFSDHPTEPWGAEAVEEFRKRYPTVRLVTESGRRAFLFTRLKNIAIKLAPAGAKKFLKMRVPGITPRYDQLLRELPTNSLFFINFADGLSQLNGIPTANVVIDTHDIKFLKHCKEKRQALNSVDALLRLRGEIGMLSIARAVISISAPETAFFKLVFAGDTFYVPSFGRKDSVVRRRSEADDYEFDLLFVASDNIFNIRGFLDFCSKFSEWLQTRKIAVAGNICNSAEIRQLGARPHIALLGYVPDLSPLYHVSKACVSPIEGTGLKIKVLDALRHGKPVFGSQHSIDGLAPGFDDCVFSISTSSMEHILDNSARLKTAQEAAVRYSSMLDNWSEMAALTLFCGSTLRELSGSGNHGLKIQIKSRNYERDSGI